MKKQFLAVMQTDQYEWMAVSTTEKEAKQAVFDGFNTHIKRVVDARSEKLRIYETTSEQMAEYVKNYYDQHLGGKVSIETLEKKWGIHILELTPNECYRDGYWVPKREQDI